MTTKEGKTRRGHWFCAGLALLQYQLWIFKVVDAKLELWRLLAENDRFKVKT